ncbi:hypothetical protein BH20CHL2_BH20CHL2_09260 [soil metagenome]|jgi:hypothetical protein
MIALRRLMIGSWGLEAGLRIRVIQPGKPAIEQPVSTSVAERAAAETAMLKRADENRATAERIRWTLSGW